MKIGIFLPTPGTVLEITPLLDQFQRVEAEGFAGAWTPNITAFDALTVLALAGRVTQRIELGSFVVPTYTRHPVVMAQQALTAQAASGNRLTLGIGVSHRPTIETLLGMDFSHPVRHLREYLSVLEPALAQQSVTFQGEEFRPNGYQLRVPGATAPSVLVAALGPQLLRLAGRRAAGTAIWMGGTRYLRDYVVPTISQAAQEAGRPAPRIVTSVPVCVTDQPEQIRARGNQDFARYGQLPSYRAILDKEGAPNPSDVALIGSEAEVRRGLDAFAAAGATDFIAAVYAPPGTDAADTWAVLKAYAGGG
ncbi:MAG TPA: TIGR03564 family F420-dependent LLM class oxidoreductase [Chloroflexota bacterium]|nr:TIGR03564 family F420-dependent LLM class oxidoreductase [Chloroflexota bacterium]